MVKHTESKGTRTQTSFQPSISLRYLHHTHQPAKSYSTWRCWSWDSESQYKAGQCAPALHIIIHVLQKVQVEITSYQKCVNQFSGKYFSISSPLCTKFNKKPSGIMQAPSKSQGRSNANKQLNDKKKKSQSSQSATSQAAQHAIEAVEFKNTLKDISSPMRQETVC